MKIQKGVKKMDGTFEQLKAVVNDDLNTLRHTTRPQNKVDAWQTLLSLDTLLGTTATLRDVGVTIEEIIALTLADPTAAKAAVGMYNAGKGTVSSSSTGAYAATCTTTVTGM